MSHRRARISVLLASLSVLAAPAVARADTVTDWNLNASEALLAPPPPAANGVGQGAFAIPTFAMMHAAIFDAVNAIDHRYKPYLAAPPAKSWYSQDAAVAAAAHRVLVSGHVVGTDEQQTALAATADDLYADALAAIPDSDAKAGGIATGEAAAWAMIAARTGDGRWGEAGFLPLADPLLAGDWRPTAASGANDPGAWLRNVDPFFVRDARRFLSRGPNALTSRRYTKEYNEVKLVGEFDSAVRTDEQTNAAHFWGSSNAVETWGSLFRTLADMSPPATVDRARFYALLYLTAADTAIATWKDKAKWMFWRPVTAIQLGDDDGNPDTKGDPGWQSLIQAPPYPDHASGLSAFGGSNVATLQELFGTDRVAFGGTNRAGFTRNYTRLSEAVDEIVDARVWSGIHFRIADVQGAKIGREVARARRAHHLLRALRHHR